MKRPQKLPKHWFIQWNVNDWRGDTAVSAMSPLARGIWRELIDAMHEAGRTGELRGTREKLARIARCSAADIDHTLTELTNTDAADVTERNGNVTLINRRMKREYNIRTGNAERKRRQRGKPDVTQESRGIYQESKNLEIPQTPFSEEPERPPSPPISVSPEAQEAARIWNDQALQQLEAKVDAESFNAYIRPLSCLGITKTDAILTAPNAFARAYVANNFGEKIVSTLSGLVGRKIDVRYEVYQTLEAVQE